MIAEAQASGLPVVAVAEGGPASLIADRQTGWLCAPERRGARRRGRPARRLAVPARADLASGAGGASGPDLGGGAGAARRRLRARAGERAAQARAHAAAGGRRLSSVPPVACANRSGPVGNRDRRAAGRRADARRAGAAIRRPDLDDPALYFNRELSWLDFNDRVLQLAEDPSVPLLERVKFCGDLGVEPGRVLSWCGSPTSTTSSRPGRTARGADGISPIEQIDAIRERVIDQRERAGALLRARPAPGPRRARDPDRLDRRGDGRGDGGARTGCSRSRSSRR